MALTDALPGLFRVCSSGGVYGGGGREGIDLQITWDGMFLFRVWPFLADDLCSQKRANDNLRRRSEVSCRLMLRWEMRKCEGAYYSGFYDRFDRNMLQWQLF